MKVSREKAALGFFIVLALAGLGVLLAYIVTVGHSLNVAASNIDDATGNLDEYTAILYKGTAEEHTETAISPSAVGDSLSSRELNKRSTQSDTETSSDEVSAEDATNASSDESEEARPVSVFALQRSYVDKNASVFVVDVENLTQYNERTIVRAGKYTFGVLSIDEVTAQPNYLQKRVDDYRDRNVDIVVCVVKDLALLDSFDGVDIVVSAQDEGLASNGVLVDGVFYNDAALIGQVGTILVSPSRTITARDATPI